jgi:hypothetical protein
MNLRTNVMTHTFLLLMVLGLCNAPAVTAQVVTPKARASAEQDAKQLNLDVIAAWIPRSVSVSLSAVSPAEGHIFVALQVKPIKVKRLAGKDMAMFEDSDKGWRVVGVATYPAEGGALLSTKAVLTDSTDGRYIPIGGVSLGMAFFRDRSMLAGSVKIELSSGFPADSESLIYLYEIPLGRSGFKLTVGDFQPIGVEVIGR